MKEYHTKAIAELIAKYSKSGEILALKDLIADVNSGEYRQRHDFKHMLGNLSLQNHKGRLGAPLMSQVNKPGIATYTHPITDDIELGNNKRISIREIVRQSRFVGRTDFKMMPGWNKMKPAQKIKAILELDISPDIQKELIAPLIKEVM